MVETGGLENRCTGNRTGGSNPSPSATYFCVLNGYANVVSFQPRGVSVEKCSTVVVRCTVPKAQIGRDCVHSLSSLELTNSISTRNREFLERVREGRRVSDARLLCLVSGEIP